MRFWLGVVSCALCACALAKHDPGSTIAPPTAGHGGAADAGVSATDRDHDGVCDATERMLGTNLDKLDSDNDGFPDFVEVENAFDPLDPQSPGLDQVGYLEAKAKASCDFPVRSTVDGTGEGYTGVFGAYPSLDSRMLTAADFLTGGSAVSAEPADNVRGLRAQSQRFDSVLGQTRLAFQLQFSYDVPGSFDCAEGFGFSYEVKSDTGEHMGQRDYMLVVTPPGSAGLDAKSFCLPQGACL